MRKVYISIPITGYDLEERKSVANELKELFASEHYDVVTPFDVCNEKDKPYSYYMGKDIETLLECSHIYFVDGWEKSKGCRAEKAISDIYGISRIYVYEDTKPEPKFEIGELVMMRDDIGEWKPKYFSHINNNDEMFGRTYVAIDGTSSIQCAKFDKDIVFTNKPVK